MKLLGFLSACSALLLLTNCAQNKKEIDTFQLKAIRKLPTEIGLPISIQSVKGKLVIKDLFGENGVVKIVNTTNGEIDHSFAIRGEGPDEYLEISNVDILPQKNELNIFDSSLKRIYTYNIDSLFDNHSIAPIKATSLDKTSRYNEVLKSESGYIATGITSQKFTLLDDSLKEVGTGGAYRPKPQSNISDLLHSTANNGKSCIINNNLLINILYCAGVISCYKVEKGNISFMWENVLSELNYTADDNAFHNTSIMGYLSVTNTDKHIYALYSGLEENKDAIATYGNQIYVYDFNGEITKKYILDTYVFGICIDNTTNKLYAITHEPEPAILEYNL